MDKIKAIIVAVMSAIGPIFKWINNAETREFLACLRSAKKLVYWLNQKELPILKRWKHKADEYVDNKIKHYRDQFIDRENNLTS